MKFWGIFRYEFNYQITRIWTWLILIAIVSITFLFVRVNFIADALYSDSFVNAPFFIASATVLGGLIWLGAAAVIAGDTAARDVQSRMHLLVYTSPIKKIDYLGSRFLAALVLNLFLLLAVQVGILLGYYAPGVEADVIGPFQLSAYLTAFAIISIPNALVGTSLQFALATWSGRAMSSYLGSFILVFMGFFIASALFFKKSIGSVLDPIGIRFIVEDLAHLWTSEEQATRLLGLEGSVLLNRLLWVGIALLILIVTYVSFEFKHRVERVGFWRRKKRQQEQSFSYKGSAITPTRATIAHNSIQTFGFGLYLRQLGVITIDSFTSIAKSWAGLALLVLIPLVSIPVILDQLVTAGMPIIPVTGRVVSVLTAPLSDQLSRWVIIPLLIIYFAGELIWRERDARLNVITDTMPGSDWAPLLGKFLGLSLVLGVFMMLQTVAGILAQTLLDYQIYELNLYLKILLGLQLPEYVLFAGLALILHVLANHKYIGHLFAILAYVFITLASMFGIEHNLLVFGSSPGWRFTYMSGFGSSVIPWLWFKLYWAAWLLILFILAKLFWVRGNEASLNLRLQRARRRFAYTTRRMAMVASVLLVILGGYVFYNTNILNNYLTSEKSIEMRATFEKRYSHFVHLPQPQLVATTLHVEIYPEERAVDVLGTYHLVNQSATTIDSIHVVSSPRSVATDLHFNQSATKVLSDKDFGYHIYTLDKPLQPGDSIQLKFKVRQDSNGFRKNGIDASVVGNGSYFTNDWLPTIGYQPSRELINSNDRRDHGLEARPVIRSLYNKAAREPKGTGVRFEAVVGTSQDQTAVAPGALQRTWTENGRSYFHYKTDATSSGEHFFFSAKYKTHETVWQNPGGGQEVNIRILHDPSHTEHLARMVKGIRSSLDYYTKQFGPYRYGYVTFVEYPGDGDGAGIHASTGMLLYEEGFTLLRPKDVPGSFDHPFAVIAHEMAHQWTVPYANVEGAPVMSESIAWYYAMKAVENTREPEQLMQLLNFLRNSGMRPEIRRGESLLRGLDPYMSYRKGPFALYTLDRYVGGNKVNLALKRLLQKHRSPGAPLATTLDLHRELKNVTPDSLQYLLHDLFEVNTYWELETKNASAQKLASGKWQLTLKVQAKKTRMDKAGSINEVPMNELVEIGVFEKGKRLSTPIYLHKHRIRTGLQTIKVIVSKEPELAGIDPYFLLDIETDNNFKNIAKLSH